MTRATDGFRCAVKVVEIAEKGLGVVAAEHIRRGHIVWRHLPGQYAVYDAQGFTARIAGLPQEQVIYELTHCFGLAEFPHCVIRVFDAGVLINHADAPNLVTNNNPQIETTIKADAPGYVDAAAQALLDARYGLIATRDIRSGEELTLNYTAEAYDPPFFAAIYDQYDIDESFL